jgi:transcription initiation factor IIE alpha subunit
MSRRNFEVNTTEKAYDFYQALLLKSPYERILFLFECYPELKELTHERLAELIGLERETVTRTLAYINGTRAIKENNKLLRKYFGK